MRGHTAVAQPTFHLAEVISGGWRCVRSDGRVMRGKTSSSSPNTDLLGVHHHRRWHLLCLTLIVSDQQHGGLTRSGGLTDAVIRTAPAVGRCSWQGPSGPSAGALPTGPDGPVNWTRGWAPGFCTQPNGGGGGELTERARRRGGGSWGAESAGGLTAMLLMI